MKIHFTKCLCAFRLQKVLDGIAKIIKMLDDLRDDVDIIAREIGRQSKQKKDS